MTVERLCHGQQATGMQILSASCFRSGARPAIDDKEGLTPLMRAAWNGHEDVVRLLVDAGSTLSATDDVGKSALDYAIQGGHREIARVLRAFGA